MLLVESVQCVERLKAGSVNRACDSFGSITSRRPIRCRSTPSPIEQSRSCLLAFARTKPVVRAYSVHKTSRLCAPTLPVPRAHPSTRPSCVPIVLNVGVGELAEGRPPCRTLGPCRPNPPRPAAQPQRVSLPRPAQRRVFACTLASGSTMVSTNARCAAVKARIASVRPWWKLEVPRCRSTEGG